MSGTIGRSPGGHRLAWWAYWPSNTNTYALQPAIGRPDDQTKNGGIRDSPLLEWVRGDQVQQSDVRGLVANLPTTSQKGACGGLETP